MLIRYWQPWAEMEKVREQLDTLFNDIAETREDLATTWVPPIELKNTPDALIVDVQLPGVERNDLDIQVARETLAIQGERRNLLPESTQPLHSEFRYGKFQRVIRLPEPIQNDQVKAQFENGILTLVLPKVEKVRQKVVKIRLGDIEQVPGTLPEEPEDKSQ